MVPPLKTFEDSVLIRLTLAGESEWFMVLANRYLPSVRKRLTAMVRNSADVDDLLQDVLLKVWRHLSTFRSQSSFRTWMTRVAINEALQLYRQASRTGLAQRIRFKSHIERLHQLLNRFRIDSGEPEVLVGNVSPRC